MCCLPDMSYSSEPRSLIVVHKLTSEHTNDDHAALADIFIVINMDIVFFFVLFFFF